MCNENHFFISNNLIYIYAYEKSDIYLQSGTSRQLSNARQTEISEPNTEVWVFILVGTSIPIRRAYIFQHFP